MIKNITAISFSPTGNTSYVVNQIATKIACEFLFPMKEESITLPKDRKEPRKYNADTLLVIGFPTYAGRLPNKILPYLQENIIGENTLAIPVVTFGNRSMDESLKELCVELYKNGFQIVAGAGIVAEHVFSSALAKGRPDQNDLIDILEFANTCVERIKSGTLLPTAFYNDSPIGAYYQPLGIDRKPTRFLKAKPITDSTTCTNCGICALNCPMAAIDFDNPHSVSGTCIKCHACIKKCPHVSKHFEDEAFLSHVAMLESNYKEKKNSVFY